MNEVLAQPIPNWLLDALDGLGLAGRPNVSLLRKQPWSEVWEVSPCDGSLGCYAKRSHPALGAEAAITAVLAHELPGWVPPVLAWDAKRNWLITARVEAPPLSDRLTRAGCVAAVTALAHIQAHLARDSSVLPTELPRIAPSDLPRLFDSVLEYLRRARAPEATAFAALRSKTTSLVDRLAGVPVLLDHGDFHAANVLWPTPEAGTVLIDWSDASLTCGLFSLDVFFGSVHTLLARDRNALREMVAAYAETLSGILAETTILHALPAARWLAPLRSAYAYVILAGETPGAMLPHVLDWVRRMIRRRYPDDC